MFEYNGQPEASGLGTDDAQICIDIGVLDCKDCFAMFEVRQHLGAPAIDKAILGHDKIEDWLQLTR